jgi:hypothetical protein
MLFGYIFKSTLLVVSYFVILFVVVLTLTSGLNGFSSSFLSLPVRRKYIATKDTTLFADFSADGQYQNLKAYTLSSFDSDQAKLLTNTLLYPPSERQTRYSAGAKGQNLQRGEILSPSDPRLSLAYEEFPLHSFETLIQRANELREEHSSQIAADEGPVTREATRRGKLVDLGSGAGRLVVYGALVNGGLSGWDVHGIEILAELHNVAQEILKRAVSQQIFSSSASGRDDGNCSEENNAVGSIQLHLGSAKTCASKGILKDADIIFCYSTVLPAPDFNVEWGAPMLSLEWSELLSTSCPKGCLVITTDRVLNPIHGWILLDKMEVDNPALFGSTGYIHLLNQKPC